MPVDYASIRRCARYIQSSISAPEPYANLPRSCDWLNKLTEYCSSPFCGSTHRNLVEHVVNSINSRVPLLLMVLGPVGYGKTTIAARVQCKLVEKAGASGSTFVYAYSYVFLAQPGSDKLLYLQPLYQIPCSLITNIYLLKSRDMQLIKFIADIMMNEARQALRILGGNSLEVYKKLLADIEDNLHEHVENLDCNNLACDPRLSADIRLDEHTLREAFEKLMLIYIDVFSRLAKSLRKQGEVGRKAARLVEHTAIILVYDQIEGLERHVADPDRLVKLLADYFYALKDILQSAISKMYPLAVLMLIETRAHNVILEALHKMAPYTSITSGNIGAFLTTIMPNSRLEMLTFERDDAESLIKELANLCNFTLDDVMTRDAVEELLSFAGLSPRSVAQLFSQLLTKIVSRRLAVPINADVLQELIFEVRYPLLYTTLAKRASLREILRRSSSYINALFTHEEVVDGLKPQMLRKEFFEGLRSLLISLGYNVEEVKVDRSGRYLYAVWSLKGPKGVIGYGVRFILRRFDKRQLETLEDGFRQISDASYHYLVLLYRGALIQSLRAPRDPRIRYRPIDCDRRVTRLAVYILTKSVREFPELLRSDEQAANEFARFLSDIGLVPSF